MEKFYNIIYNNAESDEDIMNFKEELINYTNIINKELKKYIRKEKCLEEKLNNSVEYSLMAGGKRLRPILMLATYKLFRNDYERCFPFAISIEMIHNFSLIHDDLPDIDNDDFRHGKPTNHKKFNPATAILAGDSLLNYAYLTLSKELKKDLSKTKIECFYELSNATDRMILGEYIDTEYEGKKVLENQLEYMHKNKTGALIKAAIRIGAILAEASEDDIEKLSSFAERIGLAFQIKDDILSEIGDEKILGKPVGNDKKLKKCTYVSKYGLKQSEKLLDNNIKEALEILDYFGTKTKFLRNLTLYIKNRNK